MNKAIYPGSFDPITNGHLDIIKRSSKLFDTLVIAITGDDAKNDLLFNEDERIRLIKDSTSKFNNIQVKKFDGLLIDFAEKENSKVIIRGLRVLSDFEYEFKMALMNRKLNESITTLFMMPHEKYTHVSSSLIKEVALLGGNVEEYVPLKVAQYLKKIDEKK